MSDASTSPGWFTTAIETPYDDLTVDIEGAEIHALAWGLPGRRGLVFVHGGGAHAHWWTHIASRFAADYRVAAIDLSGHGDSGHRPAYDIEQWTREVVAVAEAAGIDGPPVIVGHSMGGFVTIATAAIHGDRVAGVIVVDSPVTEPDAEVTSFRLKEAFGRPRVYPTLEAALSRLRTVPAQRHYLDYVMGFVGPHSLRPVEGGWQWKFDRFVFEQFATTMRGIAVPYLPAVRCRLALLRCEFGLVTPDIAAAMYDALGRVAPVIELPLAGHHPMLDQPVVLLTAIRTLLADWDHSQAIRPHGRSAGTHGDET